MSHGKDFYLLVLLDYIGVPNESETHYWMYGIVHVCARDGYSEKIVGHATMVKKSNIIIYYEIYR